MAFTYFLCNPCLLYTLISEHIFSILYNLKDSDKKNLFDNQERHLMIVSFILMNVMLRRCESIMR